MFIDFCINLLKLLNEYNYSIKIKLLNRLGVKLLNKYKVIKYKVI